MSKYSHVVLNMHHHEHALSASLSSTYIKRFSALTERNYDFAASTYTALTAFRNGFPFVLAAKGFPGASH